MRRRRVRVALSLVLAGALTGTAVNAVTSCCGDVTQEAPTGRMRLLVYTGVVPPWFGATIDVSPDAVVVEYAGDDGYRYRVTYGATVRVEPETYDRVHGRFPEPACDRTWEGDFEGHGDLLVGVTRVDGDVVIEGHPNTWLGRVQCLEEITGSLVIDGNHALEDLDALERLRSVGVGISITSNDALTDVFELRDVAMSGALVITGNPMLPQCDAESLGHLLANIGNVTDRDIRDNLGACQ